jgi:hypothetical protein
MGKVGGVGMDPEAAEKEEAAKIGKYVSGVYAAYCSKNGIQIMFSAPRTSQFVQ